MAEEVRRSTTELRDPVESGRTEFEIRLIIIAEHARPEEGRDN